MSAAATPARRLSIVVPAYNEATSIEWAVDALAAGIEETAARGLVSGGEVIVADDHSTDATAVLVREVPCRPGIDVRVVAVEGPQGLGSAIRAGLAAADGDLVLYTDADLPFDPAELPRLIRPLDVYRADLVCGYRHDRTYEGLRRTVQSHLYNGLTRALLPQNVRDVNFACKLLRREALDAVLPDLASTGSFIDAELVARCTRADLHLVQVGVDYFPRHGSASTLGGPAAIAGILKDLRALHGDLRRR